MQFRLWPSLPPGCSALEPADLSLLGRVEGSAAAGGRSGTGPGPEGLTPGQLRSAFPTPGPECSVEHHAAWALGVGGIVLVQEEEEGQLGVPFGWEWGQMAFSFPLGSRGCVSLRLWFPKF